MKKIFIFLFFYYQTSAQKHDYNWTFGNGGNPIAIMDFNNGLNIKKTAKSFLWLNYNASAISDKTGKLALYCNGNTLCNGNNDSIKNGGQLLKYNKDGNNIIQGSLIIPLPEKDSQYLVLTQAPGQIPQEPYFGIKYFNYHYVDMTKNNSKGQVTILEGKFCDYTPMAGKLTVCKHGNGVNYWLLVREHGSNKFHRYLITKNGFTEIGTQIIGKLDTISIGTACYSPDGTKYAIYNNIGTTLGETLEVFDFDRCSGLLSNATNIFYTKKYGAGVVFSPNSRYLYVGLSDEIRQYDMKATDITKSGITVAQSDGYMTCGGAILMDFFNGQLAPDEKIYFNTEGCGTELHVIEKPDIGGVGCIVKQHAIALPTYYSSSLCNFPNYRLGKMNGCMTATEEVAEEKVEVYPNPAQTELTIDIPNVKNETPSLRIFSTIGELVLSQNGLSSTNLIDISQLQNGIYICQLYEGNTIIGSQKLIILK